VTSVELKNFSPSPFQQRSETPLSHLRRRRTDGWRPQTQSRRHFKNSEECLVTSVELKNFSPSPFQQRSETPLSHLRRRRTDGWRPQTQSRRHFKNSEE
jgi:hypothetical protein